MFLVLVLAFVGLVGTGFWIETKLHRIDALPDYADRPAEGKGTTWLMVGSDSRPGLSPEQHNALATGAEWQPYGHDHAGPHPWFGSSTPDDGLAAA